MLALRSSVVQNFLVRHAAECLSEMLDTKVQVGSVDVTLFNKIELNDVLVEDLHHDTLIYAGHAVAGFDLLPLFYDSRLVVTSAEFSDAAVCLKKDTDGVLNIKFLVDALKSKKKKKSRMHYNVSRLSLDRCRFSYDDLRRPHAVGHTDLRHIFVSDMEAELSLKDFVSRRSLDVAVLSLSCRERSGIVIDDFKAHLVADTSKACVKSVYLKLPHSVVNVDSVVADYSHAFSAPDSAGKSRLSVSDVVLNVSVNRSKVSVSDLAFLHPRFAGYADVVAFSTRYKGTLSNFHLRDFNLAVSPGWNSHVALSARLNLDLVGLPDIDETYVYLDTKRLSASAPAIVDYIAKIRRRPLSQVDVLQSLGTVRYSGVLSGYMTDLVSYGVVSSAAGNVKTDIQIKSPSIRNVSQAGLSFSGKVAASYLKLVRLLGRKSGLDNVTLRLNTDGSWSKDKGLLANVKGDVDQLEFKQYKYHNIKLDGVVRNKSYKGSIDIIDPNLTASFDGAVDVASLRQSGEMSLSVSSFNPHALNLTRKLRGISISSDVSASFTSENEMNSSRFDINVDNVSISNPKYSLSVGNIDIFSYSGVGKDSFIVSSPIVNARLRGDYRLATLPKSIMAVVYRYLPSLRSPGKKQAGASRLEPLSNRFSFEVKDIRIDSISSVLGSRLRVKRGAVVSGSVDDVAQLFDVSVVAPRVRFGKKNRLDSTSVSLSNATGDATLNVLTHMNGTTTFAALALIRNDSVQFNFNWDKPSLTYGSVSLDARLSRDEADSLVADVNIVPSSFSIKNDEWKISPGQVTTNFRKFNVSDFRLTSGSKFIKAYGMASSSLDDSINVSLNGVRLGYIMGLVGVRAVDLDALINGNAAVYGLLGPMALNIDADARDFTFNSSRWGDVALRSKWDSKTRQLHADGRVFNGQNGVDDVLTLTGDYYPSHDSLEFLADISSLNINFIQRYLNGILSDVSADASGKLRIFGSLKKILMEGDIMARDATLKVDYLGTVYHFSDTIGIRKDKFIFENIEVRDGENHTAMFNGDIRHDYYKNIVYNLSAVTKNLMAMDLKATKDAVFYGKAYATGNVRILGFPGYSSFDISVRTDPQTKAYISLATNSPSAEKSFLTYVDRDAPVVPVDTVSADDGVDKKKTNSGDAADMKVSLKVEATPDATVNVITSTEGDMLKATGTGSIRMEYDSKSEMKLFGNYEIENGSYTFTLQNLIRRDFKLKQGGTVKWSGNPTDGLLNVNAVYPVQSVSLLDILDEADLEGLARTTVPVNCLLNLTGKLMQPDIKFDLELPSDNELQRKVKNVINTDEMMNREILSLLVVGMFYRPEYIQNQSNSTVGGQMASVLTSTVSGQLNNMLSQISDKVNVGVNAFIGGGDNLNQGSEYEVALMYQPNSRLVINSNLGYRNNYMSTMETSNNFIGDVDVEYKLTKNGKLRAKAYTHSADNYYYNISGTSKTTQGIGLMYREDFNTWRGLWRRYLNRRQNADMQARRDSMLVEAERKRIQRVDSFINVMQGQGENAPVRDSARVVQPADTIKKDTTITKQ